MMRFSGLSLICSLVSICLATPEVQLDGTTLVGTSIDAFDLVEQEFFGGIPFAEAPVGALRFAPPVPKSSLNVTSFDASEFGAPCPQLGSPLNVSEDCLTINVLRPAGLSVGSALPVMAFIYGGGFAEGNTSVYNATVLIGQSVARGTPVIYVNFNYRLGPFGFPQGDESASRGALNLGLKDQIAALEWIQTNIGTFGGDPSKVTVFGESAGAISIALLFLNSGLEHLARAAILESGSQSSTPAFNASQREFEWQNFVAATPECNGTSSSSTFDCLRQANISTLLTAYTIAASESPEEFPFVPVIDGPGGIVPDLPSNLLATGHFSRIPFIAGTNLDEGTSFVPTDVATDEEVRDLIISSAFPTITGQAPPDLTIAADILLKLYPDNPALGSPFGTGNDTFGLSSEFKRSAAIAGDLFFHALRRAWTQAASKVGVKTYAYLFTDPQAVPAGEPFLGVTHATELFYVYGAPTVFGPAPANVLSLAMMDYWISFAVNLDPNDGYGSPRPTWQQYTPSNEVILQLTGQNSTVIPDDYRAIQIAAINAVPSVFSH
ncbi:Lipase 2 [Grifola frondosa]|uniref:Carboxylic ester hydrolase n=1 Tax=Grifola frondosa TaxID=5627 RepID=A0A1C7M1H8_GRIFR|nr:Lipase 2 [Grifola frondosa]